MSVLSELVYCPLKEDDKQLTGWSKSTVEFCIKHRSRVYNSIRGIAKSHGRMLHAGDIDDIYQEVLQYMYQSDDYNISKAISTESKQVVSLEGYVHSCIKYVTIRSVTKMHEYDGKVIRDSVKEGNDGKELSLFDTIADMTQEESPDNFNYNLRAICESYEYIRYQLGPDVFQIWYIMLKAIKCDKKDKYRDILSILGISKKDMIKVENNAMRDSVMLNIAKAVSVSGIEESLEILEDFTYCHEKLSKVVEAI